MNGLAAEFQCSHAAWDLVRNRWANGDVAYWRKCRLCGRNADRGGKWITHTEACVIAANFGLALDELPIIEDHALTVPPCVVCGARGVEQHHWAPKEFFGAETDVWPVSWLCREHHAFWHRTMREARAATLNLEYVQDDPGRPF